MATRGGRAAAPCTTSVIDGAVFHRDIDVINITAVAEDVPSIANVTVGVFFHQNINFNITAASVVADSVPFTASVIMFRRTMAIDSVTEGVVFSPVVPAIPAILSI